jgi:hypothetical protein
MKLTTIGCLFAIVLFASCSPSGEKKILVLTRSGSTIDEDKKIITATGGSGSESKELLLTDGNKVTFQVKNGDKETAVEMPTNGCYFLNATKDTIVGSYTAYVAPKTTRDTIWQETIQRSIDSLTQLIEGKNVSAANRNFFIPPFSVAKVSDNPKAVMVAPFHKMSSLEKEDGKDPEVYNFFTVGEIRAKIAKQTEATKPTIIIEPMKGGKVGKKG